MAKPERYALLYVADRSGIIELGYALKDLGFTLISAGGTAAALRQAELEVLEPHELFDEDKPGSSEQAILDSRVLAGIEGKGEVPISLVAANLYPVSEIVGDQKLSQAEILSYIDLAASAVLRAAARSFRDVLCLCDPDDYQPTVDLLKQYDRVTPDRRQVLAAKAFHYSAYYDSTVAQYLGEKWDKLPDELVIGLKKTTEFAYGENPQQRAALYTAAGATPRGLQAAQLIFGKPLTFSHFLDLEVAWELAAEIGDPACVIVKHGVPAGVASSERLSEAARLAYRCDPRGCFRGTAAVNRELEEDAAVFFAEEQVSCIAAPAFSPRALQALKPKKDVRLVTLPPSLAAPNELDVRAVPGGMLVQERDIQPMGAQTRVVTRKQVGEIEMKALNLAWRVAKYARTHSAVICRGAHTIGIGSGQTARLDALRVALAKSQERHPILPVGLPIVLASDGALSSEHVHEAAQGGVTAIIQPGGTSEDADAIAAADQRGVAMVFAGLRHFRH